MIGFSPTSRIMGIDPSTYVGIAQLEGEVEKKILIHFPDLFGYFRLQSIATAVGSILDQWKPDAVIIESYSLGSSFNLVQMVEVGTLIRRELFNRKIPWYNCPPSSLKLFCTGSGKADKPRMAEAVKQRWDFTSPSDDVIDAYALAKLGQHIVINGPDPTIKGLIRWDMKPTPKKRSAKKPKAADPKLKGVRNGRTKL